MEDFKQKLDIDIKDAMWLNHEAKRDALRLIKAEIQKKEIELRDKMELKDIHAILQKMIKQREESFDAFQKAGRTKLANQEQFEKEIISQYLPPQLSIDEINEYISDAISFLDAKSIKDMGKVLNNLKPILTGKADMALVSKLVKAKFE